MAELDRLLSVLFPDNGPKLMDLKFFPGEQPVTVEEFCRDVHSALVQVDTDQAPKLEAFAEDLTTISVDKFLA